MQMPAFVQLLARGAPLPPVAALANAALARVLARHAQLFDRLGSHSGKTFAFVPADLPYAFVIRPAEHRIRVTRPNRLPRIDVTIRGPITTLLALAEGRVDGDAAFFSRGLSVDGDMEAAVALRNAMDDCRIDLPSDLAPDGLLRWPVQAGLGAVRSAALGRGAP